jgi:anti-sigma-K factor RskA
MSEPGPQGQPDEALVDLLIKQVTEGLSPAEQRELDALDSPDITKHLQEFERAAAAISLAGTAPLQAPPPALLAKLEQQASSYVTVRPIATAARQAETPRAPRSKARGGSLGWLAAAACLLLAVIGWLRSPPAPEIPIAQVHETPAVPPAPPPAPPTPAEERTALLASSTSLKITLGATKDPAAVGVTGDVVWDPATQKGFLHFVGLKANDPGVSQYQIWIFDGERDKRYPIDGGVFDVPGDSADIVIPIRAAVLVHKPAAFAVTAEKPGGVVVSDRAHVIVLGAAG